MLTEGLKTSNDKESLKSRASDFFTYFEYEIDEKLGVISVESAVFDHAERSRTVKLITK